MVERTTGAIVGSALVGVLYGLSRLSYGWTAAIVILLAAGWLCGGYVASLRRSAERDELTGMANRRPFERALHHYWQRSVRTGEPLSLVFIDIDDFGLLNKRHGHLAGDEALKMVCRQIRRHVRKSDLLCRWGGEEFVVLLPGIDLDRAGVIAERIRAVVQQCHLRDRERLLSVTVSAGVSGTPGNARTALDLLRQAISAQSAAKIQKNAVEVVS